MYISARPGPRRRGQLGGLGTVCTSVAGSMVCGSDASSGLGARIQNYIPVRGGQIFYGTPTRILPAWGRYGGPASEMWSALDANPDSLVAPLTASQLAILQRTGAIAGTVPADSAGLIQVPGAPAPAPAPPAPTPAPVAASTFDLASIESKLGTLYGPLPLYAWLGIAAGAYFMFGRKGRR
jgi:hypothetical protein